MKTKFILITAIILTLPSIGCFAQKAKKIEESIKATSKMSKEEAKKIQKNVSEQYNLPNSMSLKINENVKIEFVLIPPGEFNMGSYKTNEELARKYGKLKRIFDLEYPQHKVTITKPFYIGKFEVTQEQWSFVMGSNPSHYKSDQFPVEFVSWNECLEFCNKLSELIGKEVRFPTEAEWELACRAGTISEFNFGDNCSPEHANIDLNCPVNVGSYPPNAWGLCDMHGNVKEWVADDYYQYTSESQIDPIAPAYYGKMIRGGGYKGWITGSRSSNRYAHLKSMSDQGAGLRLAISINTEPIK